MDWNPEKGGDTRAQKMRGGSRKGRHRSSSASDLSNSASIQSVGNPLQLIGKQLVPLPCTGRRCRAAVPACVDARLFREANSSPCRTRRVLYDQNSHLTLSRHYGAGNVTGCIIYTEIVWKSQAAKIMRPSSFYLVLGSGAWGKHGEHMRSSIWGSIWGQILNCE